MTLTFDPGQGPDFAFQVSDEWIGHQQPSRKPFDTFVRTSLRPVRTFAAVWRALTEEKVYYFESFFHEIGGPGSRFQWRPPFKVFDPGHKGPDLDQVVTGGAPASARTYYVSYTWYHSSTAWGGETRPSPSSTLTVASGSLLTVQLPTFPLGAESARIYASEDSGNLWRQSIAATERLWTEPIGGLTALTALPPSANGLRPERVWRLVSPIAWEPLSNRLRTARLTLQEEHALAS